MSRRCYSHAERSKEEIKELSIWFCTVEHVGYRSKYTVLSNPQNLGRQSLA